ncbi:MAG: hypothetical protein JRI23_03780, partial [Deltaproteobacteria bacterium]|nr:hypothetical protein [Deltaproteobacteria bacterium]MBW2530645.1 hypothetical protein [Deltaproteobacteria bacterium]
LDAAGSAATEEAADLLGAIVAGSQADKRDPPAGAQATAGRVAALPCRVSPGYGRWGIEAQHRLFPLLPHDAVGVSLLPSCLMVPRKSISFAMWLGARGRIAEGLAGCSRCTLAQCRFRRGASAANSHEGSRPSNSQETP